MAKRVVIVTVNYNQNNYTLKCIESLLKSDYKDFKIILLDNGSSSSNVVELSDSMPIDERLKFIKIETNVGYAQGTNIALKEGFTYNPEYFLIINNDTVVDEKCITELVNTACEFDNKVLVTGKVYDYDIPNMLQIVGYELVNKKIMTYKQLGMDEIDEGQYDKVDERDMIDDVFVLQPVSIYKNIGGYSPYFWVNGVNIDMGMRARRIGYPAIYTPRAKIWHKGSVSIGGRGTNPKLAYWNIQSSLILRYLYLNRLDFIYYYVTVLRSVLGTFIKSIFYRLSGKKGIYKYAYAKYKGLLYFNNWVLNKRSNDGKIPFST